LQTICLYVDRDELVITKCRLFDDKQACSSPYFDEVGLPCLVPLRYLKTKRRIGEKCEAVFLSLARNDKISRIK
jgi:hypothetical protein